MQFKKINCLTALVNPSSSSERLQLATNLDGRAQSDNSAGVRHLSLGDDLPHGPWAHTMFKWKRTLLGTVHRQLPRSTDILKLHQHRQTSISCVVILCKAF